MRTITATIVLAACQLSFAGGDTNSVAISEWSEPVKLQNKQLHDQTIRGRLLIVRGVEPALRGSVTTNRAMTFVELQNVSGAYDGTGIDILFDVTKLNCDLSDGTGRVLPKPDGVSWSGPGPLGPYWLQLPYNSTIRLFVNGGSLAPLMVYPNGEPWCYWSIPTNDTNVYFLAGTLSLATHTNTTFSGPPGLTERYWQEHCTAKLLFPKTGIHAPAGGRGQTVNSK